MRIKYITEDDLNAIKSNLAMVYKSVFCKRKMTIEQLFDKETIVKDSAFEIEDFNLDMSQPVGSESLTDFENIQRVYNHMRYLTDSQASDERLWAAYTFSVFLDYMIYRWPVSSVSDINHRYLYGYSVQRALFRNGIARLWWIGRFTYDENREDPYELTKFICKDQDYIKSICGRNVFNSPVIRLNVLSALNEAQKNDFQITREAVRDVCKYFNVLSGTYLLDALDSEWVSEKVYSKLMAYRRSDEV